MVDTYSVSFSISSFSTSFFKTSITSFEAWASSLNADTMSGESNNDDEANDPTDLTCSKFGARFGDPIPPKDPELTDRFSLKDFRILLIACHIRM